MSTLVELKLDSAAVDLGPGETATLQITVTNLSDVVDAFGLKILGLDPAWYTLAPAEVSLFPSKSSQIQLQLHPPRGTYAGPYPFTVLATSRDNPLESSTVGATLNMAAEGGAALGIEPKRIKGKTGLFAIALTNGANTARSVILSVTDPEEALRYTLGTPSVQQAEDAGAATGANPSTPPTARPTLLGETTAQGEKFVEHELEVPAGSTLTIPLQVKPLKRVWTGRERVFVFQAGTHPPGVEWEPRDALKAQAELVYRPVFAAWAGVPIGMRRLLAIGIPLLLLLLIFWLLLRPQPGPSDALAGLQATQTAQARSAQQTQTAIADQLAAAQNDATRTALSREAEAAAANATQTAQANANVAGSTQTALAVASATVAAIAANGANGASDGVPSINKFWLVVPDANAADPAILGSPNLEWDVTDAASVRVTEANQPFPLGGLDTASQVEYQLIVTGTNSITGTSQVATSTLSVIFIRPPLISALNVSQATINAGGSTSLSWQVKGARSATLDGVAVDLGPGGTGSIDLSPSATHRYILCVSNQAGTVCRSVKVTVIPAGTPIPTNTPAPSPTPCTLDYSIIQQSDVQMVPGVNDVGNHCDNCTTSVGLPFSFKLYEQSYSSAIVGSNGTIGFVSNTNPVTNTCFPNPQLNYAIMPHWDDLTTNGPGLGVFTSVSGNAPNRIFNIEWRAARAVPIAANRALLQPVVTPSTAPPVNFVVRLHENSPVQQFDVVYGRVDDLGNGATIGVQRGTGANFTQYACNTSDIEEGLQLTFLLSCGTSVPPTPSDGGGGRNTLTCGPSVVDIRIVNGAPQPRNVTVNVGTTVRWINLDAAQRSFGGIITGTATVAGNPGTTSFNSGTLNQGVSFEYTFTTPGVFTYSSPGDPNLSGTITVVVACTPTPSSTITATPTSTAIGGATSTDVPILIGTATTISVSTNTPTSTSTGTATETVTTTATPTETGTATITWTATLIPTNTPRGGGDPQPTSPPRATNTRRPTSPPPRTATQTATRTATLTVTRTPQPTFTPGCVISDYSIQNATGAIAPGTASIGNSCDDCTSTIGLPFAVTVYGQTFAPGAVVNASSNGNLQFISTNTDPNNVCLPYAGFNTSIMPYWDDLTTNCSGCGIFTSVSGSPGNRIFDIEWRAQAVSAGPEIVATPIAEQTAGAAQGRGPGKTKGRGASGGLVTEDLTGPLTPDDLANTLVGSGVTISNVAFTGADVAGGEFSGGTGIIGFESGVILGSGNINSVVGPNTFTNTTTINSTAGDPHLDALSAPEVTSDAAVLEFDFVPAENTLTFDYVFSSEEYNEYAGPGFNYNDVFAFFVNGNDAGHNCALIGESPVSVDTINLKQNSAYYRDNDFAPNAPINTEMDGLTTVLSCLARVEPGVTNHMKLAIADVGDAAWDTNVFLKAGSVSSGPTATPSSTVTATETPTPTATDTPTTTPTPSVTPTASPSLTPTASPTPVRVNFEIRLFENPALNKFEIIYGGVSQGGDSATIGVQSGTGARFKQYSCDTGSVSAGTRLIFTYGCPGTTTPSATPSGTSTTTRTATVTATATNTATPTYTPRPTNTPPGPNCIVAENTTPVTYPPLGVITSTIFVPISGTIADLNVFDLHIARNNAPGSPLVVRADLISPDKTQVNLFNWGCKPPVAGSTDRMFITLDSEAAAPIPYCSDQVVKGTYQSDQPLTAYNNRFMPAGTWTLMLFTESQRRKADGSGEIAGSRPVAELLSYRKLYKTVQLAAVSPTAEGEPTVDPSAELSPEPEPTLAEPTKVAPEPTDTKTTGKATPTEHIGRASSTPTYDPAKSTTTVEPEGTAGSGRATGTATKGPVETPTDTPTEAPTETPTSVVGLPPPMGGTPTGTPNPNGGTLIRWGLQICFMPATATPTATATATSTACPTIWRTIPSPTTSPTLEDFLFSVDTLSATDAWAVGFTDDLNGNFAPVSMHWNGTVWNSVPVPNPGGVATALYDVKMIAPNNVWAVGYTTGPSSNTMTFIIHWNGTSWSQVPSPNPGGIENVLNGIAGVADNDLWAVGIHRSGSSGPVNLVLHWNGTSWSQVPNVPNPGTLGNSLDEVTLASPGELWAVGWQNNSGSIREGLVLRLDIVGGTWTIVQSPTSGVHSPLHDVAAIAPGQVWAVGEYAPGSGAITWRCNNVSCADIASPGEVLYGVTNVDKTLAWAVGRDDNNQALIIRWDGGTGIWSVDPNAPPGFSSTLYAVDALSPTYAWAVGNYAPTSGADFDNLIQWYSNICPGSQQAKYKTNSLPGGIGGGFGGPGDWSVGFDLLLAVVIVAVAGAGFSIAFSISRPSHVIMEAQQARAKRPAPVRNTSGSIPVRIVRASRR